MEVTGLEPGKRYEFRVKAHNEEGESDPLEGDDSIVAKDPFGKTSFMKIMYSIQISYK